MRIAAIALATVIASAAPALSQHYRVYPEPPGILVPPSVAMRVVRALGLNPIERPFLRGRLYIIHAVDDFDDPVRVVIDAHSGALLRVAHTAMAEPPPRPTPGYNGMRRDEPMRPARPPDDDERAGLPERLPPAAVARPHTPTMTPPTRQNARAPLPRPRPAEAAAPATSSVAAAPPHAAPTPPATSPSATSSSATSSSAASSSPGRSIPAPVASRALPAAPEKREAPATVPVAPLE